MSGVFGASHLFFSGASEFYDFEITNSLRFDDSENQRLEKPADEISGSGSTTTWTWSAWVKRGDLQNVTLWSANSNSNQILINSNKMYFESNSTANNFIVSSKLLRDTSSWYNLVFVWDTTNSTEADRMRMYCNGVRITSFSSSSLPTQNRASVFNTAIQHEIGRRVNPDGLNFDGYMAEVNFIDGQALDASSFGELKSGVWIPKDTSGLTYGTNGYRLEFKQTGTNPDSSGMGADTSGNNNHYNPQNLNAFDVMPDSPTNNFPTLNPQIGKALTTFVDPRHGNLEIDTSVGARGTTFSTMAMPTGNGQKFYAEYRYRADTGHMRVGIISVDQANQYIETNNFDSPTTDNVSYTSVTGKIAVNGSQVEVVATYTVGDVIGMAVDLENGTIQFSKNGSNVGSAVSQSFISSNEMLFAAGDSSTSQDIRYSANFGQDSTFAGDETAPDPPNSDTNGIGAFHSAVPSGFKALCAKNLPEPTISPKDDDIPEDYFNTVLYVGDDSTSQSITGVGFQPDWVWIKARNSSILSHALLDSVRGVNKSLFSDDDPPSDENSAVVFPSFDSDGFTVSDSGGNWTNENATNFVAWNWLAGGSPSSNSAGDITSSVSANTEAGFSIVGYTGDGTSSTRTIGCGLTKKPDWVILKNRTDDSVNDSWFVWHQSFGTASPSKYMTLYNTDTVASSGVFVDSSFSDNSGNALFAVDGSYNGVNKSGTTYIVYCFHEVEGYSKFGSYTGNSSDDGAFVFTGFRPAWVMLKRSSSGVTASWVILDKERDVENPTSLGLFPNSTTAEASSTLRNVDFLSNGFKLRTDHNNINGSGGTYIYMAFAEMPFKYANAR